MGGVADWACAGAEPGYRAHPSISAATVVFVRLPKKSMRAGYASRWSLGNEGGNRGAFLPAMRHITTDPGRPLLRLGTSKGREPTVFEPAIDVNETCCTHPGHLVLNRSTMIFLLSEKRIADFLLCSPKLLHFVEPDVGPRTCSAFTNTPPGRRTFLIAAKRVRFASSCK